MKRTVVLGVVVLLALFAAACAPTPTPAPPTAAPTAVPAFKAPASSSSSSSSSSVAATTAPTVAPTAAATAVATKAATVAPTVAATTAATAAPTTGTTALPNLNGRALKVGSDTTYPPFEFVDKKTNQIVGYDVDIVNEICKLVNCKATFVTTGFDTIFVALSQKQFDMVASGVTITDDRKKTVDFGDPYLHYDEVLLVRVDETRITGADDLKTGKYIVGVQTGTSNEETAKTLVPDETKQLKRFDTFDQAIAALIGKDVDVVEIDKPAADGFMAQNPGKLKVVGKGLVSNDLGFAFQKGDKTLIDAFNAGLKAIKANGTADALYKKWFVDYKP